MSCSVNPNRRARSVYPLVVVLQADIVEADTRIVAPLTTTGNRAESAKPGFAAGRRMTGETTS